MTVNPARRLALAAALTLGAAIAAPAGAGEQRYEPLSASVKTTLHRSVADRASPRHAWFSTEEGMAWLLDMSTRLAAHMPDAAGREAFLTTVHYEASRAGLDPQLILAIIDVESRFRKYAVSRAGARGYMQVMPFWVDLIGEGEQNLFSLRTNLRYGCTILRHYLDIERGNLFRALGRYNGSLGKSAYPNAVLKKWRDNWAYPQPASVQRAATKPPRAKPAKRPRSDAPTVYLGDG